MVLSYITSVYLLFFFLSLIRAPPRSTLTDPPFPYTTLFRLNRPPPRPDPPESRFARTSRRWHICRNRRPASPTCRARRGRRPICRRSAPSAIRRRRHPTPRRSPKSTKRTARHPSPPPAPRQAPPR